MDPVTDDDTLKRRLAVNLPYLLEIRGWTQSDLARALAEEPMNISRFANGRNLPRAGTLRRMAEVLCTSTDFLLDEHPEFSEHTVDAE